MAEPAAAELAERNSIRLGYKIIAYIGAWIAALLLTAPGLWPLAWMFPLGLLAVFDRHLANAGGWGVLTGCYAVYVVHGFFYFRSKTTLQTVILYAVLVILLIGNVAGCREMMHTH
jgi:predicted anti-sigma-YlaC factor YlaD